MPDDHRHSAAIDGTVSDEVAGDGPSTDDFMRRRHWTMLAVAIAIVLLSFAFQVRADQRIEFRWLPGLALPQSCLSRSMFDVNCPGCGLTRSLVHLAHGDLQASFTIHRIGWLMAAAILLQIPFRLIALYRNEDYPFGTRLPTAFGWTLIALLFGNWVVGVIFDAA